MPVLKTTFATVQNLNTSYSVVPSEIIKNLPSEHLAVYIKMSSYSPNWIFSKSHLRKQLRMGINKLNRILSDLRDIHLVNYYQERRENGRFSYSNLIIKDGKEYIEKIVRNHTHNPVTRVQYPIYTNNNINNNIFLEKKPKNPIDDYEEEDETIYEQDLINLPKPHYEPDPHDRYTESKPSEIAYSDGYKPLVICVQKKAKKKPAIPPTPKRGIVKPKQVKQKSTKYTQIAIDWTYDDRSMAHGRERGLDIEREKEKFIDYNLAHGNRIADWNAHFRGWLNTAHERKISRVISSENTKEQNNRLFKEDVEMEVNNMEEGKDIPFKANPIAIDKRSTENSTEIDINFINRLFEKFGHIYGALWKPEYKSQEYKQDWLDMLKKYTVNNIYSAFKDIREFHPKYPPSIFELDKLCEKYSPLAKVLKYHLDYKPEPAPTLEQSQKFSEKLAQYRKESTAEVGCQKTIHPKWNMERVNKGCRQFDQKEYDERRKYLVELAESESTSLERLDKYDRISFMREDEATKRVVHEQSYSQQPIRSPMSKDGGNVRHIKDYQ